MGIVSSKSIFFKPSEKSSIIFLVAAFETQNSFLSITSETEKTALYSGSSKHGNALLASVD